MPSSRWIWVSIAGLAVFVVVVATQSLLVAGFDPATRMISEYVHTSRGALMTAGFVAWSVSLAALAILTAGVVGEWDRAAALVRAQTACLVTAAASALLLACFATDRGAEVPGTVTHATAAGHLHDAASALTTVSLLAAALIGAKRSQGTARVLTLALLAVGLATVLALLVVGDPAPGIRQRALLAAGCLWQIVWLRELTRWASATSPRSNAGSPGSTS